MNFLDTDPPRCPEEDPRFSVTALLAVMLVWVVFIIAACVLGLWELLKTMLPSVRRVLFFSLAVIGIGVYAIGWAIWMGVR